MGLEGFEPPPRTHIRTPPYKSCTAAYRPVSSLFRNLHTRGRREKEKEKRMQNAVWVSRESNPRRAHTVGPDLLMSRAGCPTDPSISSLEPAYEDASTRKKRVSDRPVSSLFRNLHTKMLQPARKGCPTDPFHLYFGTCIREVVSSQEKTLSIPSSEPAYEGSSLRKTKMSDRPSLSLVRNLNTKLSTRKKRPFYLQFGTCIRGFFNPQEKVKRGCDKKIMDLEGFEPPPRTGTYFPRIRIGVRKEWQKNTQSPRMGSEGFEPSPCASTYFLPEVIGGARMRPTARSAFGAYDCSALKRHHRKRIAAAGEGWKSEYGIRNEEHEERDVDSEEE
ncbi:hypothetical protein B0H13DRAFT_1909029 [Mycena leptocephala]|nr:hypothetical protein B0H13DRAFT_1909029 [Mycena leptocephala]